jgi:formylglycine-generating enzyme required for sulfatase activity
MFETRVTLLFITVLCLTGGCGRQHADTSSGGGEGAETLPVFQPKSGGEMVLVAAGRFTMGDAGGRPDETLHEVSLEPFYLDRFPVTQELYEEVMGVNPSKRKGKTNPVERTQWTDAVRFCNRCSEMEGLAPYYDSDHPFHRALNPDGYRLPTEAEWEYACRAGSQEKYFFGDAETELSRYAWFKGNSGGKTRPVGQKLPNRWGLYDMHGNVWQWCDDWYPPVGKMKVLRGGAWDSTADQCRDAYRHKEFPVYSDACFGSDSYGFRRARGTRRLLAGSGGESAAGSASSTGLISDNEAKPRPLKTPGVPTEQTSKAAPQAPERAAAKINPARLKGSIVFVSDRSGTLKIWKMHASGKDAKQLTQDANPDADPRFAPDGQRILYTSLRGGFPEIWVMKRDGSEPKLVTKGSQGSWSPDGKAILFIRDNQAFVRDLQSGQERRVTPEGWERCGVPAWSPDGKRFAVASRHLGDIGIFILGLDGKEQLQLKTEEPCCTPQWSRNGKKILCQTVQGHIHQVDLDGSNWEQMTFGADVQHDARYSPDGSLILFCRAPTPDGPWQICVKEVDADDLNFTQLTKEGSNLLPDWHAVE